MKVRREWDEERDCRTSKDVRAQQLREVYAQVSIVCLCDVMMDEEWCLCFGSLGFTGGEEHFLYVLLIFFFWLASGDTSCFN